MEHIKSYTESVKNYFQKSFDKKANSYLDNFKKSYDDRTKSENILVECLFKLEFLESQNLRYAGAAEGILLMEDYLKTGNNFEYETKKEKFLFMTFETKETYREHIIRLVKQYLKEKNIL